MQPNSAPHPCGLGLPLFYGLAALIQRYFLQPFHEGPRISPAGSIIGSDSMCQADEPGSGLSYGQCLSPTSEVSRLNATSMASQSSCLLLPTCRSFVVLFFLSTNILKVPFVELRILVSGQVVLTSWDFISSHFASSHQRESFRFGLCLET